MSSSLPALLALACFASAAPPMPLRPVKLETCQGEGFAYYRLWVAPGGVALPNLAVADLPATEATRRRLLQMPRLRPVDGRGEAYFDALRMLPPGKDGRLCFLGRWAGDRRPEQFVLSYPTRPGKKDGLAGLVGDAAWRTARVHVDWTAAVDVRRPATLELQWRSAELWHLAALEARTPGLGLFTLARQQRSPWTPALVQTALPPARGWAAGLYELTTGADALTESLALRRTEPGGRQEKRTRDVRRLRGIDVAEHPWEKMMAGKKPAAEPLAHLVPPDCWYFTAEAPAAFVEAADLLQCWGGSLLRPFSLHDRDHDVRARYERQLCLPSAELVGALPDGLVRCVALAGSDLFLQEGTDVTALFEVSDPEKFLAVQARFLAQARRQYGTDLAEGKERHRDVPIETFTTPRREVSLHRAVLGKVVACSNSLFALQRVIARHARAHPSLGQSLDFQYMRTVFPRDPQQEDGFLFLSDAFIRRLVGPATRIKQGRRLAARAALTLLSHAAVVAGWQSGKLPAGDDALRKAVRLPVGAVELPEGKPARWDGDRGQAVSEAYNTLRFLTPLVELPIDDVTAQEADEYEMFRDAYTRLWRRYFDPVGIRFRLGERQVVVDTYILPLVNSSRYNLLREMGLKPSPDDPGSAAGMLGQLLLGGGPSSWLSLNLADDGNFPHRLAQWLVRRDLDPAEAERAYGKLFWQAPLVLDVRDDSAEKAAQLLAEFWAKGLKGGEPSESDYRGVTIRRRPIDAEKYKTLARTVMQLLDTLGEEEAPLLVSWLKAVPQEEAPAALYAATLEKQYLLGWSEEGVKRRIDVALARRKGKPAGEEVHAALHAGLSGKSGEAVRTYLEWQTHVRAQASLALWEGLRRAGVGPERKDEARRLLGYLPASPDGTAFTVDADRDEVHNERHGSLARPVCHDALAPGSPLAGLLDTLQKLHVRFRFREDGIHTTLTLERAARRQ